jgi:hypothetical protein
MMVTLCDGSVRGVAPNVTTDTWNKACLPNDGNVITIDW